MKAVKPVPKAHRPINALFNTGADTTASEALNRGAKGFGNAASGAAKAKREAKKRRNIRARSAK